MNTERVITFSSTHQAMKAEEILTEENYELELVPTPRQLSSECGFALLIVGADSKSIYNSCQKNQIGFSGIYKKIKHGGIYYEKDY